MGAAAALRRWATLSTQRDTIRLLLRAWACAKMLAAVRNPKTLNPTLILTLTLTRTLTRTLTYP